MATTTSMKLYLWPDHQRDWTAGVCFAIAEDEGQARDLIRQHPDNYQEPSGSPEVHELDEPFGFSRAGGG